MGTVLGKRALVFVGWTALGGLCAIAFGLVTGIVRPDEKINALWLVVASACFYVLAYRFYGRFLARRVLVLDDRRPTPAHRLGDGANFTPTNRWVLFGHHFAAIAGAGPLLGPVLAAQFGFLPGFLWLVIGAVLAGAVQDFIILVASMRRNGRSLPEIARDELGLVTGTATAVAVLFIVVVAVAGLGFAVVSALYLFLLHGCVRRRVWLSLAGLFRDDAENDRARIPGHRWLWRHVIGKFCRCDGVDCSLGVNSR